MVTFHCLWRFVFVVFQACVAPCLLQGKCSGAQDLIDEEHEVCFGFVKAGRCKIGQNGICVIEKMNLIRLCATS